MLPSTCLFLWHYIPSTAQRLYSYTQACQFQNKDTVCHRGQLTSSHSEHCNSCSQDTWNCSVALQFISIFPQPSISSQELRAVQLYRRNQYSPGLMLGNGCSLVRFRHQSCSVSFSQDHGLGYISEVWGVSCLFSE